MQRVLHPWRNIDYDEQKAPEPMPPRPACAIGLHLWGPWLTSWSLGILRPNEQARTCTRQGCDATERREL